MVIDEWSTDGEFLPMFVSRWLAGDGLLVESIEGRRGLAWVHPPAEAGIDTEQQVLVDTFEVYAWQQERAEAEAVRQQSEAAERYLAAERRHQQMAELVRPLYQLLRIVQPRPAKYSASCFTCGTRIETGEDAAMMNNALTGDKWRLFCKQCSTLLAIVTTTD